MKYLTILFSVSLCFSTDLYFPDENLQKLGNDWFQITAWVDFHEDITQSKAKENATNLALKKIIEHYSGVHISSTAISILGETNNTIDIDHFSQIINSMTQGLILEKEILETGIKTINTTQIYCVTLKAKVGTLKGDDDPFFKLDAQLNRDHYQEGDEMVIDISTTKDCFIFVFNIYGDNTVSSLLPNQYNDNNFLQKGYSLQLPPKTGKITTLRVGLEPDKKQSTEMIMVLAVKPNESVKDKNFDFNMGNYTQTLNELMEFIMNFDRNQIEQVNLPYVVVSGK
jgi:hypothetical protein